MFLVKAALRIVASTVLLALLHTGAASDANPHEAAIRFGIDRSSIVITGQFGATAGGGGGATSQVNVIDVHKAPPGFNAPDHVTVFWLSSKRLCLEAARPAPVILFLRAVTDSPGAYYDASGEDHSFVPATEENLAYSDPFEETLTLRNDPPG